MRLICYVFVFFALTACNRQSRTESRPLAPATPNPVGRTSRAREVPSDMKEKLIEQALVVVREHGRSVEGLDIAVSEGRVSWTVWFTPRDRRQFGGSGFVVEIDKEGRAQPRFLKQQ